MSIINTGDRMVAQLMVFFGATAMFLATIGIYGVMANLVCSARTKLGFGPRWERVRGR